MALHASTIWEVRTSGSNNNGGGWHNTGGASTDYSQQDAAQLSLNDVVTDGTTTVTSATGGFTDAMVGNIINILTKGRFEIVARTDTNTITIDRTATAGSGLTANVGGAVADLEQIDSVIVAGNNVYTKAGTYAAAGSLSFTAGASATPVRIEGYNATRGDDPTGANRPLLSMGANAITAGSYTRFRNFRLSSSILTFFSVGATNIVENCEIDHSGAGYAISAGQGSTIVDCDIDSNGTGIDATVYGIKIHGCYIHDLQTGIELDYYGTSVEFCIFDTCSLYGVYISGVNGRYGQNIVNNVFYGCGDGIYSGVAIFGNSIMNNIFSDGVDGIDVPAGSQHNHIDYNNFYNNSGSDVKNVTKGPNDTAVNPQFTNAAGGNFSLQAGSPCIGAAFATRLGVG